MFHGLKLAVGHASGFSHFIETQNLLDDRFHMSDWDGVAQRIQPGEAVMRNRDALRLILLGDADTLL